MDKKELAELLLNNFCGNFAEKTANTVIAENAFGELYDIAMNRHNVVLPASETDKLVFRSAYILETVFKFYPDYFWPYKDLFFEDFPKAQNGSAKRHYCNIMSDLLDHEMPDTETAYSIAEVCTEWMSDPKVKVAVKIKGTEILIKLMNAVPWIKETLSIVMDEIIDSPQPAMAASIRKWKRKGWLAEIYK